MGRMQVVLDGLDSRELEFQMGRQVRRDEYRRIVDSNPDLRLELTSEGDLIVMAPAHSRSGEQNMALSSQLWIWSQRDGQGVAYDSSTGFDLPNGSNRSPDAAWVSRSRLDLLLPEQKAEYLQLSPDFVVELRSKSNSLSSLKGKMHEYMENGTRLGWLIDPIGYRVYIYRPATPVERLEEPESVCGEPELPGFVLDLSRIWNPQT